jgi:CheY-like chemotaxis protein
MFERGEFDLVFTDLGMSGMSGYKVIRALKACREQARVIVLTGWPEEIISQALDPKEVQGILCKPFEADRPIYLVNEVLSLA